VAPSLAFAFERVRAPTLIVAMTDDLFQTMEAALLLEASLPHARLVTYRTGGHTWVGRHDALCEEVRRHVDSHT